MRIKFKTITRSTDKESSILIEKILMELDKPVTNILNQPGSPSQDHPNGQGRMRNHLTED